MDGLIFNNGKSLCFGMIEGEYIIDMRVHCGHLFVLSNLFRVWKSTEVKNIDQMDFIDITEDINNAISG